MIDLRLLQRTIELAEQAYELGNYPIGALIADEDGEIVVEASNESITSLDPSAHAEILCYRKLANTDIRDKKLILYSSLEPCLGCGFFLRYTKILDVIWALKDNYKGSIDFLMSEASFKEDFANFKFIGEPDQELREKSRDLMYRYLSERGKVKAANFFRN